MCPRACSNNRQKQKLHMIESLSRLPTEREREESPLVLLYSSGVQVLYIYKKVTTAVREGLYHNGLKENR